MYMYTYTTRSTSYVMAFTHDVFDVILYIRYDIYIYIYIYCILHTIYDVLCRLDIYDI